MSIGIPKDSVLQYDAALKTDKYLLVVHGTAADVEKAKGLVREHRRFLTPFTANLRWSANRRSVNEVVMTKKQVVLRIGVCGDYLQALAHWRPWLCIRCHLTRKVL